MSSVVGLIAGFIAGFGLAFAAVSVILFVLSGFGRSYVLKKLGYENSWVGWVPYVGNICLGLHLRDEDGNISVLNHPVNGTLVAWWPAISFACCFIPVIGTIAAALVNVFLGGSVYGETYRKIEGGDPSDKTILGYVSGFIGLVATIKFFCYWLRSE